MLKSATYIQTGGLNDYSYTYIQTGDLNDYSYPKLEKLDLSLINFILPSSFDEHEEQLLVSEVRQTTLTISF